MKKHNTSPKMVKWLNKIISRLKTCSEKRKNLKKKKKKEREREKFNHKKLL